VRLFFIHHRLYSLSLLSFPHSPPPSHPIPFHPILFFFFKVHRSCMISHPYTMRIFTPSQISPIVQHVQTSRSPEKKKQKVSPFHKNQNQNARFVVVFSRFFLMQCNNMLSPWFTLRKMNMISLFRVESDASPLSRCSFPMQDLQSGHLLSAVAHSRHEIPEVLIFNSANLASTLFTISGSGSGSIFTIGARGQSEHLSCPHREQSCFGCSTPESGCGTGGKTLLHW